LLSSLICLAALCLPPRLQARCRWGSGLQARRWWDYAHSRSENGGCTEAKNTKNKQEKSWL
jgi:hypothetical protein